MNNNDHLDHLLGRLLDDAAASFEPTPDPARLQHLVSPARRRGVVMVFSAAACLAFMGGAALAIHNDQPSEQRLTPGAELSDRTTTTGENADERDDLDPDHHESDEPTPTQPDFWDGPEHDEPKPTEPKATEPTEPKPTEPPRTEPPRTEPQRTEPPRTEPPRTEPTEPQTTEPQPTEPPHVWPWSVHQAYGQGAGTPPYDVFYGTAAPGAKIVIEAEYGREQGYANDNGEWEIRINFYESPLDTPFKVWVVSGDHTEVFWFTHTAGD